MKISAKNSSRHVNERGAVLYVVLVASVILGVLLLSYLRLVSTQSRSVARSRAWNLAIPVAEAGIEEALAQIARNTNAAGLTGNGWFQDGSTFVKKRDMGDKYFLTKIIPSDPPVIESHGFARIPYGSRATLERRIRVVTTNSSIFNKAMVADGTIDLNGNNIATDSFDSSDPAYSTGGLYDPAKNKDGGDVATNSGLSNSLAAGNANIMGEVSTGFGGTVGIGASGVVGDEAWHAGGNTGIQPGMSTDDMNIDLLDKESPFTVGFTPVAGTIGSTNYTYLVPNGDYSLSSISMSGSDVAYIQGDVRLYVAGDISMSGNAAIEIAPGASLTIYAAGARTSLGGTGIVNGTGDAASFSYVGLETNTQVRFGGNADFVGTIYAPEAALTMGGGGSTAYDFVGAVVANTISMNGHFNFHYDEALAGIPTPGFYTVTSWNEF